jgi:hypothetical protein
MALVRPTAVFGAHECSVRPTLEESNDRLDHDAVAGRAQPSCVAHEERLGSREQLARPREALPPKAADREIGVAQRNGERIAIGVTGDLTEDPVDAPGRRQDHGGTKLRSGEIGEGEPNQDD